MNRITRIVLLLTVSTIVGCRTQPASHEVQQHDRIILSELSPYFGRAHRALLVELGNLHRDDRLLSVSFGEGWGHLQVIDRWRDDDGRVQCARYMVVGYDAEAAEDEELLYVVNCPKTLDRYDSLREQVRVAGEFLMEPYDDLTSNPIDRWHLSAGTVSRCRPPFPLHELAESYLVSVADGHNDQIQPGMLHVPLSKGWVARFDPHPAVYVDVAILLFDRINIERFRCMAD